MKNKITLILKVSVIFVSMETENFDNIKVKKVMKTKQIFANILKFI